MAAGIRYIIILGDGETWDALESCRVVGISARNRRASRALEDEDLDLVLELADVVVTIEAPPSGPGKAESEAPSL